MKIKIPISLVAVCLVLISSCSLLKEKMTCDNAEELILLQENIKSDLVECWALKLAAEDYEGYKYGFFGNMSSNYKQYLIDAFKEIKEKEGLYYDQGVNQYEGVAIILSNIITDSYDESIDKCECSANVELSTTHDKNNVTFDNIRNSEGEVTGHYRYRPKAMLDDQTNASDFIKEHKDIFE